MIDLAAHEGSIKAMGPSQIVARYDAMIDPINGRFSTCVHIFSFGVYANRPSYAMLDSAYWMLAWLFSRPLSRGPDQISHRLPVHPVVSADFNIVDVLAPARSLWHDVCGQVLAHRCRRFV